MRRTRTITAALTALMLLCVGTGLQAQSGVRLNRAIELLDNGDVAFGILSFDYSLNNARSLARSGLDFVIIDMEHAPFDVETLREFLLGMTDKSSIIEKGNLQPDVAPIVRIPVGGDEDFVYQVKQVLDVGVFGVMFPYINTAEQAELAVRATRYPQMNGADDFEPAGLRGRNPANASWYWGVPDYHARADVWPLDSAGELLAIIQIESPEGVENIRDIVAVPGVGVVFIGPSDLSISMGYASPAAPEVEAAIQTVLDACLDSGVPCAITTSAGSVAQRVEEGFRFVTVGADGGLSTFTSDALTRGRTAAGR